MLFWNGERKEIREERTLKPSADLQAIYTDACLLYLFIYLFLQSTLSLLAALDCLPGDCKLSEDEGCVHTLQTSRSSPVPSIQRPSVSELSAETPVTPMPG